MSDAAGQTAGGHYVRISAGGLSRPRLPYEPRILNPSAQETLTNQYLMPVLDGLKTCLLSVRNQLDPELEKAQPTKLGKPFPLGQCLEISMAVQKFLLTAKVESLPDEVASGLVALRTFRQAGGDFRMVWGDLRGEYFQNAFQLGMLYVDVANDTVVSTKPKVEILPFHEAQLAPILDFDHFRRIARRYWGDEVYPNHLIPELAPHCPLIHFGRNGAIRIHNVSQYMLSLTRTRSFVPSEQVLREPPMPAVKFEFARRALQEAGCQVAGTPEEGRRQALLHCIEQRTNRCHWDRSWLARVIRDALRINLQLEHWSRRQIISTE